MPSTPDSFRLEGLRRKDDPWQTSLLEVLLDCLKALAGFICQRLNKISSRHIASQGN